jgi:hypothetical protein
MSSATREQDLLDIVAAAHRARAAGAVEQSEQDDHGNTIVSYAHADGTVFLEKQAVIGGWNIVHLAEDGGYRSTTRGPFGEDPATDSWIDAAWGEVTRILTAATL